ncbi:MAG: phosphoribosylamine--glycine ligase [Planctomycetota bacterium]
MPKPKQIFVPESINVLLIGGGGREHALAWRLKQSKKLGKLWATHHSNPGIAKLAHALDYPFSVKEAYRTAQFCEKKDIHLIVVGPEQPLCDGITDQLGGDGTGRDGKPVVFGPTRAGAMLEGDKAWTRELLRSVSVPMADGRIFENADRARAYIDSREEPVVVKAAGLAAGKGVFVCDERKQAEDAIQRIMVDNAFGDAGKRVIVEERLKGEEVSVFALVDGRSIAILDLCQDHKRLGEGDTGPNTGGMGAYCPADMIDRATMQTVEREIIVPTIDALRRENIEFRGVLYAGLMLTPAGPKLLEYNVRFGDPECQVLMPRLTGDFAELLHATATGRLHEADFGFNARTHACCVVLASEGYPGEYHTKMPINGLAEAAEVPGVHVFHAGTKVIDKQVVTAGGRVLNVVGTGESLEQARERAYQAADLIDFRGKTLRRDIASKAMAR